MADIQNYLVPDKAPELPRSEKRTRRDALDFGEISGLPANLDAEKTILGAILLDNESFLEASEKIEPDDFSLDSHRRIFQRMGELMKDSRTIDIVTLANELMRNKEIEAVGGVAYLASLTEGLPRRPVINEYILIVKDKSVLRKVMLVSSEAIARAADQSDTGLDVASDLGVRLEEIVAGGIQKGLEPVVELTHDVLEDYNKRANLTESPGLSFGVEDIDNATGGIQDGEQVVVGCYSGVGKTTLLAQAIAANCMKGRRAAVFLLEPTYRTFMLQLYTIVGQVRYIAATKPYLATKEERERIRWAAMQVAEWDLFLNDKTNLTLDEQIAQARMAIHRKGVEIIGLDYIQRMKVTSVDKHEDTRIKIARASMANADLVKGTKCRSIILSQLNRSGGMGTLPTMSALRESGQIENDAATIILLHLKYDEEQGHFTDEGAAIIPKQRFGVPCNVKLHKHPTTALWMSGGKDEQRGGSSLPYRDDD